MNRFLVVTAAIGLTLTLPPPISAKGPTAKIIITGGQLSKPLEVTNPEVLRRFNPWGGEFRDGAHRAARVNSPADWPSPYEVQFYVKLSDDEIRMKYVVYYRPHPGNEPGYIYLPVKGERWHSHNATTIITTTGWFHASREWDTLIKPLIAAREATQRR